VQSYCHSPRASSLLFLFKSVAGPSAFTKVFECVSLWTIYILCISGLDQCSTYQKSLLYREIRRRASPSSAIAPTCPSSILGQTKTLLGIFLSCRRSCHCSITSEAVIMLWRSRCIIQEFSSGSAQHCMRRS
jgi:hypothetical protein